MSVSNNRGLVFQGPQEAKQLQELFATARVYIATSQYEPFGLAPLEAAFSRCAIVASDIPSLREIWDDTAIYFANNDSLSLQETLNGLVAHPGRVNAAASRAFKRAMRYYTSSRMTDQYLELYKNLVPSGVLAA
jgi:glycosyltransferase involved in cell wall biosynthesis